MLDLVEQQKAIERLMADEAQARQKSENDKAARRGEFGDTRAGRYYVKALAKKLAPVVSEFMAHKASVRKHILAAKELNATGLSPELIAYLAVKATINAFISRKADTLKRVSLCRLIAERIHDEWRVLVFSSDKRRKALLRKLMKDFDRRTYPRDWRKRTIKNYFDAEQLCWEGWSIRQKIQVGFALACLLRDTTGMIVHTDASNTYYTMSDEFQTHLAGLLRYQAPSYVLYRPMVVPPKPWTPATLFRGGYYSDAVKRYPIVKGVGRRDIARLNEMDWSQVLPAVNALQETAWRVNPDMLAAVDFAYSELTRRDEFRNGVGKLVNCDPLPLPPEPDGYREDPVVTKEHNKTCFLIHSRNREDKSRRIAVVMALSMAKQFSEYERIYFPHNLDSRGRAYPIPSILNPQGPDYVKAMLEFAAGEPVENEAQANWLAIAGANAYGNDKISLEERVRWVKANEEMILGIATDWRHDLRWCHAGEPFQFLRFCLEWASFRREGYGFLSHMVVPVDATCSGLQHYAAMLRDEIGGRSVNLIPGLDRQDIYGDVAQVVIRDLLSSNEPWARDWLTFGIDRKMTKRQVMVVPYAGKFSSCLEYTHEALNEKLKEGATLPWDFSNSEDHRERVVNLARLIWSAIDEVVVKGKEAMQWLSRLASEYSKWANEQEVANPYERRMTWVTPDGFEVVHYREDETRTRLRSCFDGSVRLVIYEENGRLNAKDMALAMAPNFVHSLDATHLRMTIIKALELGITQFGMVHDSFGVHARHMPEFLSQCVKPSFVHMYQDFDVLQMLYDRYSRAVEIEPPPSKGTLDLSGILRSEFVFS